MNKIITAFFCASLIAGLILVYISLFKKEKDTDNTENLIRLGQLNGQLRYKKALLLWATGHSLKIDTNIVDALYYNDCPKCITADQQDSLISQIKNN